MALSTYACIFLLIMDDYNTQDKGYGKRPLWQWIVIYLIIGLIVYGVIYYLVLARKSSPASGTATPQQGTQQNPAY